MAPFQRIWLIQLPSTGLPKYKQFICQFFSKIFIYLRNFQSRWLSWYFPLILVFIYIVVISESKPRSRSIESMVHENGTSYLNAVCLHAFQQQALFFNLIYFWHIFYSSKLLLSFACIANHFYSPRSIVQMTSFPIFCNQNEFLLFPTKIIVI